MSKILKNLLQTCANIVNNNGVVLTLTNVGTDGIDAFSGSKVAAGIILAFIYICFIKQII